MNSSSTSRDASIPNIEFGLETYNNLVAHNKGKFFDTGYFRSFGPAKVLLKNSRDEEKKILQNMMELSFPLSTLAAGHKSSTQVLAVALVFLDANETSHISYKEYYEDWNELRLGIYDIRRTDVVQKEIIRYTEKYIRQLCTSVGWRIQFARGKPGSPAYAKSKSKKKAQHSKIKDSRVAAQAPKNLNNDETVRPIFSIEATPKEIGGRIREARKAKGWTQLELANAMGLKSPKTVENIETAASSPNVSSLILAMQALDIQEI